jgi:hypothetical protein
VRQLLIEGAVINIVRYVCVLKGMLLFVMNKFHQMPWYKKQIIIGNYYLIIVDPLHDLGHMKV